MQNRAKYIFEPNPTRKKKQRTSQESYPQIVDMRIQTINTNMTPTVFHHDFKNTQYTSKTIRNLQQQESKTKQQLMYDDVSVFFS